MAKVYEYPIARVFPEACPRCGSISRRGYCAACRAEFARVREPCARCGLVPGTPLCPRRRLRWRIDAVVAPFVYAAPLDAELIALKSPRGRRRGRALGLLLADDVGAAAAGVDVIVPVPLHASRLRERGFNQAVEIGRALSRRLAVPLAVHGAARTRGTSLQSELDVARRAANLARAFVAKTRFDGRRVAIVDDVLTTGATVDALAEALRAHGAERVDAWAVARARPGG